jgi:GcrA cell cycle regulator
MSDPNADRTAKVKELAPTLTVEEIAATLKITTRAVYYIADRVGVTLRVGPKTSAWPDEQVAELKLLFGEGKSFSQIAVALNRKFKTGHSRNAALGKAKRIGLERGSAKAPQRLAGAAVAMIRAARKPPREGMAAPMAWGAQSSPVAVAPTPYVDRPETAGKKTLLQLLDHDCKWGVGDPRPMGFRFCAEPVEPGRSYCPPHCRRAYIAPKPPNPKVRADLPRRRVA